MNFETNSLIMEISTLRDPHNQNFNMKQMFYLYRGLATFEKLKGLKEQ